MMNDIDEKARMIRAARRVRAHEASRVVGAAAKAERKRTDKAVAAAVAAARHAWAAEALVRAPGGEPVEVVLAEVRADVALIKRELRLARKDLGAALRDRRWRSGEAPARGLRKLGDESGVRTNPAVIRGRILEVLPADLQIVTVVALVKLLGFEAKDRGMQVRVGQAMQALGWRYRRIRVLGVQCAAYERPAGAGGALARSDGLDAADAGADARGAPDGESADGLL